jgi:hypothetical protein
LVCKQKSHSMFSSKTRRWVILKYSRFLNFLNFFNLFHDYWFHFTTNTNEWKHDSYDDVLMQFRWNDDLLRSNYFLIVFQVSASWEVSCNIRRVSFSVNHTILAKVVFKQVIDYWW